MRRSEAIPIAIGGVVGATCRWGVVELWPTDRNFPWPVFAVNVIGSFVVGIALAEESLHPAWEWWARDAVGIGFCGGSRPSRPSPSRPPNSWEVDGPAWLPSTRRPR